MTGNTTEDDATSTATENFEIISTLVLCVVGGIGNILVVLVVCRQSKMRTVTNFLIVNLAASDLFVLFINIPLDLIVKFSDDKWLYGASMCKLIPPLQTMSTTVSVWSLVAISIGRYIAIVYPLRPQLQTSHAKWIILVVWTIGLVVVIPFMLALELKGDKCEEDFPAAGMVTWAYTIGVFVAQYVVPLAIIMVCYIKVGAELSCNNNGHENSTLIKEQQKETKKIIKILRLVVTAFAVLVLPIHLLYIWIDFFDGGQSPKFPILRDISVVMLYGNSASNPILYNICNDQFREGFKQHFRTVSRTFCAGKDEEYSNETKESECISLVYSPKGRLSTASHVSVGGSSITPDSKCMPDSLNSEEKKKQKDSCSSFVTHTYRCICIEFILMPVFRMVKQWSFILHYDSFSQ
ncbi:neuropeptide SIFamide receptor-like [Dendronephthya gigantea]|uniref:neuropeptide SIFamide receptor-like n=1 Tax=Dendronephthya gigantea TaxID=151771 RepID=UPI00106C5D31|nr:neuropeptide SIFamide receptor-like [Dendronephthya gigantea]XP_028393030.1 neuropeptide SIFamide receptor-like [Dendronephthya gigantea]XP_028393031.1 neuropeptide SIFamide receptor-like [Dendronephthya gigantea]XP_028393032.1 neuropeptide SIFamide receptor-like [Dendronephthya gigantea]XP_028393033.1 neuropeptide SIFamide receptor-like [Dendronephthya gigantea]